MKSERGNQNKNLLEFIIGTLAVVVTLYSIYVNTIFWIDMLIVVLSVVSIVFLAVKFLEGKKRLIGIIVAIVIGIPCVVAKVYTRSEGTLPPGTEVGELEIDFDELILSYEDEQGRKTVTNSLKSSLKIENIEFESFDYDVKIKDYKLSNNKLVFQGVPSGNFGIDIKFENYDKYSEKMKLNKKELEDGKWTKTITLQEESDFKNFEIEVFDSLDNPLEGFLCDVGIKESGNKVSNIVVGKNGELPYSFSCKENSKLNIVLHDEGNDYEKTIDVNAVSGILEVCFDKVYSKKSLEEKEYKEKKKELEKKAEEAENIEKANNPQLLLKEGKMIDTNIKQSGYIVQSIEDNLSEDEKEKVYSVVLEKEGPYWIDFNHANLTDDYNAWKISIVGNDGETYLEFNSNMNRETTSSCAIGLPAGEFLLSVNDSSVFSDAGFQLNLMTADISNYENEPNGEVLSANQFSEIKNNEMLTKMGNLSHSNDVDYYALTVDSSGVLALRFDHENLTDDQSGWNIKVKNSNSETIEEFDSNWKNISSLSRNIGLKAGTYFIEITAGSYWNNSAYALNVVFHSSDVWEEEFNNEVKYANDLVEGFYEYGNLSSNNDIDYYVFQCEKSGTYEVLVEHENLTEDSEGWKIDVLDKNCDSLWEEALFSKIKDTKTSKNVTLKKGETYYLSVQSNYSYVDADYKIKMEFKN